MVLHYRSPRRNVTTSYLYCSRQYSETLIYIYISVWHIIPSMSFAWQYNNVLCTTMHILQGSDCAYSAYAYWYVPWSMILWSTIHGKCSLLFRLQSCTSRYLYRPEESYLPISDHGRVRSLLAINKSNERVKYYASIIDSGHSPFPSVMYILLYLFFLLIYE